ncbi:MAG TPA: hypothetical protein VJ761_22810 [Ktedonobacteraceae bacterium]|nr:hypothetical protein [Ktedonobacteraceae bacterium]
MRKLHRRSFSTRPARRRRFSPLILVGVAVTIVVALGVGGVVFVLPHLNSHAAGGTNTECSLIVPAHPLTAAGLATPYQLVATNPNKGPCNEANTAQSAFVQAAIIDTATGKVSVYEPLVIDKGTTPAAPPVVPQLSGTSVVGVWFGFNGDNLTLRSSRDSLQEGNCVNGVPNSVFGQFSYCNAPAFFKAANKAIAAGTLVPPAVGMAKDGLPCPTVRDFGVVDQDQSDNVQTQYLATPDGRTAQFSAANQGNLQNATLISNPSDNALLTTFLNPALGCQDWQAPDLANNGSMVSSLALDELQAAAHQANPIALIPSRDPMVLNNNNRDLSKINAYRVGVDQQPAQTLGDASTITYCQNLRSIGAQRMQRDTQLTQAAASPDAGAANSLFTFLAQRFVTSYGADGLNCAQLLKQPDPVTVTTDSNGVAIAATINGTSSGGSGIACSVNGTVLAGCTGTTTINGQACTFAFDDQARQVTIKCDGAAQ